MPIRSATSALSRPWTSRSATTWACRGGSRWSAVDQHLPHLPGQHPAPPAPSPPAARPASSTRPTPRRPDGTALDPLCRRPSAVGIPAGWIRLSRTPCRLAWLTQIRSTQVRSDDRPSNVSMPRTTASQVSCTTSSAVAVDVDVAPGQPQHHRRPGADERAGRSSSSRARRRPTTSASGHPLTAAASAAPPGPADPRMSTWAPYRPEPDRREAAGRRSTDPPGPARRPGSAVSTPARLRRSRAAISRNGRDVASSRPLADRRPPAELRPGTPGPAVRAPTSSRPNTSGTSTRAEGSVEHVAQVELQPAGDEEDRHQEAEADRVELDRVRRVAWLRVRVDQPGQAAGQERAEHGLQTELGGEQRERRDRQHGQPDPGLSAALGLGPHRHGDPDPARRRTHAPRGHAAGSDDDAEHGQRRRPGRGRR